MGFDLLLAMLVAYYLTRNTVQDLAWKARGEDPPSFRRERERWERRQAKRAAGDGPGRQFWRNVWRDAVASAEERRERVAAKSAEKRRAKWAEKDTAAAEDEAYAINERLTDPTNPADRDPAADDQAAPEPTRLCHFCHRPTPVRDLWPARTSDDTRVDACPQCWDDHVRGGQDPTPAATGNGDHPEPSSPTDPGDAEIIQFADWQRPAASDTEKENSMSAEITGLRSAIEFAKGSAAACDAAVTQTESAISGLQAGGTSGPAITELQQAMEALTMTAGRFRSAGETLSNQLQVAEAYEANQGAGTREFVTSE